MAEETVVRCPGCRVGIKIKAVPPGKKAFACPKCKTRVPYPELEEEDEIQDVVAVDDEDEDEDEERPPRDVGGRDGMIMTRTRRNDGPADARSGRSWRNRLIGRGCGR